MKKFFLLLGTIPLLVVSTIFIINHGYAQSGFLYVFSIILYSISIIGYLLFILILILEKSKNRK